MVVEIVCVGTELLLGDIVNTNAAYLAKQCADLGFDCFYHVVIGDNSVRLSKQIKDSLSRCDVVIVTGGLGPTYDDITKAVVAQVLGEALIFDEEAYRRIESYFSKRGRKVAQSNRKQAYTFKDSITLYNEVGTAPGHVICRDDKTIVLLQGPPFECQRNFETQVKPILRKMTSDTIVSHSMYLMNIGESDLETLLASEMEVMVNPTVAPYAMVDGVRLRITAKADSHIQAEAMIAPVIKHLETICAPYLYSLDKEHIEEVVGDRLHDLGLVCCVIDNITGGHIFSRLGSWSLGPSYVNTESSKFDSKASFMTFVDNNMKQVSGVDAFIILAFVENKETAYLYCKGSDKIVSFDVEPSIQRFESKIFKEFLSFLGK